MQAVHTKSRKAHLRKVRELEEMVLSTQQPPAYRDVIEAFSKLHASYKQIMEQGFPAYSVDHLADSGIYSVVTQELLDAIQLDLAERNLLDSKVIEVCAGRGLLSHFLKQRGIDIVAIDNYTMDMPRLASVQKLSHAEALEEYRPEVVLAFWPVDSPAVGNGVLGFPSVNFYLSVDEGPVAEALRCSRPAGFSSMRLQAVEEALICHTDLFEPRDGHILEIKCSSAMLYQRRSLASRA